MRNLTFGFKDLKNKMSVGVIKLCLRFFYGAGTVIEVEL